MLNKAKEYALRYISYRPRTAWEVNKKLTDKGYDTEIITLVMVFLKEYNFLNDEEFTRMWVSNRLREKPSGPHRIYSELVQKGVDKDLIERHLAEITLDKEEEMAMALVEKKCRKVPFNYNKIQGFLLRRGFKTIIVRKVLAEYAKNLTD